MPAPGRSRARRTESAAQRGGAPHARGGVRYTRSMNAPVESAVVASRPPGWEARLDLAFERDAARTLLATRRHVGPLRVQKTLHPEGPGVCQAIIVHPPGGIVGGDSLTLGVVVGDGAHAQLTTPGASKWYRSAGADAVLRTTLSVESAGRSRVAAAGVPRLRRRAGGDGDANRTWRGRALRRLGRSSGSVASLPVNASLAAACTRPSSCNRDGALLWCERTVLDGGSPALQSGAVLAGAHVFGTMIVGGPIADALLAACREVACAGGDAAVTRLPDTLVARYRGNSTIAARTYFASVWRLLRPALIGRAALPPRIWNT